MPVAVGASAHARRNYRRRAYSNWAGCRVGVVLYALLAWHRIQPSQAQGLRIAEATQRCPGVAPGSWGLCSGPSIPAHRDDQRLDIVFGSLGHAERSIECLATGTRRVPAGAGSLTLPRERLAADGWAALLDSSSWPLVIRRPSWMLGFLCLRTVLPDWFVPPLQENVPSSAGCSACRRPFGRQNA